MTIMSLYEKIKSGEAALSLVGLGYVGMPLTVAFAAKGIKVIGFNRNQHRIDLYRAGIDPTHEVGER